MLVQKTEMILNVLGCEEFTVSLNFCSKDEIQALNARYRKIDKPTDVLSFPQLTKNEQDDLVSLVKKKRQVEYPLLGDIAICPAVAAENAKENNKDLSSEIVFLIVHSVLHLLGYDHNDQISAKRMQLKEREVLNAIYK